MSARPEYLDVVAARHRRADRPDQKDGPSASFVPADIDETLTNRANEHRCLTLPDAPLSGQVVSCDECGKAFEWKAGFGGFWYPVYESTGQRPHARREPELQDPDEDGYGMSLAEQ